MDEDVGVAWRCDGATFDSIYRRHSTAVHTLAVRACGASMAEDVTQDVFVRLWRRPDAYDPERGTMRAYLVVMVRHVAVDHLRSQGARRARELRTEHVGRAVPAALDHRLLRDEEDALVATALGALGDDERAAITIAFYGGCTYRETAVVLGIPEGTVKTRIRRGLHHMRSLLESPTFVVSQIHHLGASLLSEQLMDALDARQTIEQATGVVAERTRLHPVPALELLRAYARGHDEPLSEVARAVVAGSLDARELGSPRPARRA